MFLHQGEFGIVSFRTKEYFFIMAIKSAKEIIHLKSIHDEEIF